MERKQDIRKELLKKRNSLTEAECKKYSKLIENRLFSFQPYIHAKTILVYASYQKEVSTYGIIEQALNAGKFVFCPKVLSPGKMEFYKITSLAEIAAGYKNIPEPTKTNVPFDITNFSNSIMIMPLVGFDTFKNRLGYGGGFYDRYIQRFPHMKRVALAFECQKYNNLLPINDATDQKPDYIMTEERMI